MVVIFFLKVNKKFFFEALLLEVIPFFSFSSLFFLVFVSSDIFALFLVAKAFFFCRIFVCMPHTRKFVVI